MHDGSFIVCGHNTMCELLLGGLLVLLTIPQAMSQLDGDMGRHKTELQL